MPVTILRKVTVSGGTVLRAANNLGDVADAATSRTNLGLGTGSSPQFSSVGVGGAAPGSNGLKVFGTTASTSTTTGALQVAGGVGIAGRIYAGSDVSIPAGSSFQVTSNDRLYLSNGNAVLVTGGSNVFSSSASQLTISPTTASTSTTTGALVVSGGVGVAGAAFIGGNLTVSGTGTSTFAGPIRTAAPTGGAGDWELGVANSVTPTSPNRTITIEIGGTVYYLHAKTTND